MKELECSQDFPHHNPMVTICCHGNQSSDPIWSKTNASFPNPNNTPDEIWFQSARWSQRYSSLIVWIDGRTHVHTDAGSILIL